MARHAPPGHFRSVDEFRAQLRTIDSAFDVIAEPDAIAAAMAQPIRAGALAIGNRFAVHPMEGWDGTRDGGPSEHTLRRWRRFGESGAKLIWGGEAFAVQEDGRANPNQLFLSPRVDVEAGLSGLLEALRDGHRQACGSLDGLVTGLQLTHSGRWSRPDGAPAPRPAQRNPWLDPRVGVSDDAAVLTDAELEGIAVRYVEAARRAQAVGFDFVDVKACHGYLLHELLGARARPGRYGGSFENRTRLFAGIVEAIRRECQGLEVGVRVSIADLHPFRPNAETRIGEAVTEGARYELGFGADPDDPLAFDLEEPLRFLGLCQDLGISLVNLSLGSPYYCPHLSRPATYPPSDGYLPPEDPLASVLRHLRVARACEEAFGDLVFVGTGYTYLQEWLPHVAAHEVARGHVDLVGLGRMTLIYPEMVRDVLAGRELDRRRICRTFSDCTTGPRNGMISGCFPLDPYYRAMPEAARLKAIKKGETP